AEHLVPVEHQAPARDLAHTPRDGGTGQLHATTSGTPERRDLSQANARARLVRLSRAGDGFSALPATTSTNTAISLRYARWKRSGSPGYASAATRGPPGSRDVSGVRGSTPTARESLLPRTSMRWS